MNTIYKYSDEQLLTYANNIFVKLLNSIMKKELYAIKHLISNELYESYDLLIKKLIEKDISKLYENIFIQNSKIVSKFEDENHFIVLIKIDHSYKEAIVNSNFNIISGSREQTIKNTVTLKLELAKNTKNLDVTRRCEKCNAALDLNNNGVCAYCGYTFPLYEYNWILTNVNGLLL